MPKEMQINGMAGNQIYKMTLFSSVSVLQFFFLLDVKSGGAAINLSFFLLSFFLKSLFSGGVSYQNVHLYIL